MTDDAGQRDEASERDEASHRGGFGEFGGETSGLIDRSFREQIVLVGVQFPQQTDSDVDANLDELARLVDTAGADAVERVVQRRKAPDPATFVGAGKAEEIHRVSEAVDADTVVFDDELTPAQQANLQSLLKRSALDRTAVILDIFAQNASTLEGKAQVELAQLRYRLPRLRGRGSQLSQQAGGIGARRGPGETQLEVDRRRIQHRLSKLEGELADMRRTRRNQRKARLRSRFRTVSIVGYTNAGKSTLLNRLTGAGVLVEDRLFATLDATTRRLSLPGGETVLISDTVGFIRKLPHHLVEAFRSTLEEVAEADLLLHVVDATAADVEAQVSAVRGVLREIGAGDVPELIVVNKSDATDMAAVIARRYDAIPISAATGSGIDDLLATLADRLRRLTDVVELLVPYDRGDVLASLHREGEVLEIDHTEDGIRVLARLEPASVGVLRPFVLDGLDDEAEETV
jgi:GTP-binding protein HflX